MAEPVFVSFFTENWRYAECASQLRNALRHHGCRCDFRPLQSTGDWLTNTALKASFISKMLRHYDHIVWIDADSQLYSRPELFFQQKEPLLLRPHSTIPDRLWHVGAMGIRRTPETIALCDAWKYQVQMYGGTDEACFDAVIRDTAIRVQHLPAHYHALPKEEEAENAVLAMGLSLDETKLALKERNRAK